MTDMLEAENGIAGESASAMRTGVASGLPNNETSEKTHATSAFDPLMFTTDWNEEWKEFQKVRQRYDDAAFWDAKSKTFPVKHGSQQGYVDGFLKLACIKPDDVVLDMGCGTGSIATPLAMAGNKVIACDFSRGMLDVMTQDQDSLGVTGVEKKLLSWSDDWDAAGIGENCVDVAIASRSIATDDMKDALTRLTRVARRRACITLSWSASPRADDELLKAAGLSEYVGHDFVYAFNILIQMGLRPEVGYIPNTRVERFECFDDALEKLTAIAREAGRGRASADEMAAIPDNLRPWLEENLVEVDGAYQLKRQRDVVWAFIAWDTDKKPL